MGNEHLTKQAVEDESMEEILSSIRKIMSTDLEDIRPPKTKKFDDDDNVLELTKRVDLKVNPVKPISSFESSSPIRHDRLMSSEALSASVSALSQLNQTAHAEQPASTPYKNEAVEKFLGDLVRPMLKDWLDKNLPRLVETIVQREIQSLKKHMQ
ncbi:MAG: DUF2497 domain-containing protein [Alphaproteobacteria bacterium]